MVVYLLSLMIVGLIFYHVVELELNKVFFSLVLTKLYLQH